MMRRRRPVLRAATMAGGAALAYHAGKGSQANASQEDAQDAGTQQAAPAPPTPVSTSGGPSQDALAKLKELGQLRDQGILNEQEFEAQKQKVLGG
jgi:Short C-terminal domain